MVDSTSFRLLLGFLSGLLLTACMDADFSPSWKLDRLRILAMSAQPATLKPGESAKVSALVVDEPQNRPLTLLWLGCAADPFGQNRGPCSNEDFLKEPASFLPSLLLEAQNNPENMSIQFLGIGPGPHDYETAPTLFSMLPEEHPQRKVGTFGMVLLMVVAEAMPQNPSFQELAQLVQRVQDKHVDSQTALFRIPVREDNEPNQNPIVSHLLLNGAAQNKSALMFLEQGREHVLDLSVPAESFEAYVETTYVGTTPKTETLFASFFSTCGELKNDSFNFATSIRPKLKTSNEKNIRACPSLIQRLFAVVYDSRSGQTWHEQPFVICQKDGPSPLISQAWLASAHTLNLEGKNLEVLAELRLGGHFLWPLPVPQNGQLTLSLPAEVESGTYVLSYTDLSCRTQTYGELIVP